MTRQRRSTATRRSSTSSRRRTSTTPRSRKPADKPLPQPGPGERVWVLDIPYDPEGLVRIPGVRWHPNAKAHLYVGERLSDQMSTYRPGPYTLGRFIENQLNPDCPAPPPTANGQMRPRPNQVEAARAITLKAAAGGRMFLLADEPGVGKTISAILGARAVGKLRDARRVLVVADRPAAITIGHWCRTIAAVGDGGMEWVVTTWDRLAKVNAWDWDIVIADEAHALRRTTTKRWQHWVKVSGFNRPPSKAPFVIHATATPGGSPLELPYLIPAYAQHHAQPITEWYRAKKDERLKAFAAALTREGITIEKGRYGHTWTDDPATRARDLHRVRGWLSDADPPGMIHRPAPWGPVPISGMPVTLTAPEAAAYDSEWGEFQREMGLARRGQNTARGRAALLRFRQKAGLIRVDSTVDWIAQQVEAGRQVACSVEFVETAADPITERLQDAGLDVARLYGQGRFDTEAERMRFQTGQASVCVFTVTASISLHAGETLSGGVVASTDPRVGVFHQARFSGIAGRQVTGRTHRDGQVSPWQIAWAEKTVEERVGRVMVERIAAASDTVGGDTSGLADVAALLGADWLPPGSL
ncbi:MAG: hypothetical protein L0H93_10475, partial [Nocardioides sp.]|nr:hypothetical protein [Nocardioides sp.]